MCYERRSYTTDAHKKANTVAEPSKERDGRREEVVNDLLRASRKAGQKADGTPAKEYTPAK